VSPSFIVVLPKPTITLEQFEAEQLAPFWDTLKSLPEKQKTIREAAYRLVTILDYSPTDDPIVNAQQKEQADKSFSFWLHTMLFLEINNLRQSLKDLPSTPQSEALIRKAKQVITSADDYYWAVSRAIDDEFIPDEEKCHMESIRGGCLQSLEPPKHETVAGLFEKHMANIPSLLDFEEEVGRIGIFLRKTTEELSTPVPTAIPLPQLETLLEG